MRYTSCEIAAVAAVLMTACSSNTIFVRSPEIPELQGPFADALARLESPPPSTEIMQVDAAVLRYLRANVATGISQRQQLHNLESLIRQPDSLNVRYDPTATLTAQQTFAQQRGNCMSLSLLFAALARELGIDAKFQEVEVGPHWDRRDGVVFSARHINVVGKLRAGRKFVMDFYPLRTGETLKPTRFLTDNEAFAQYYNNIGAEALANNEFAKAYLYLGKAARLAPAISYIWSNLGVLLQRNRQFADAEAMLRHAILIDRNNSSAYSNLVRLYADTGRTTEVRSMSEKLARMQSRNPYYHFARARRALSDGRPEDALSFVNRAIRLKSDEPVFAELAQKAKDAIALTTQE